MKKYLNLNDNKNYDCIVPDPLSNSTKIDDLFCKIRPIIKENGNLVFQEISSNFLNAINSENASLILLL